MNLFNMINAINFAINWDGFYKSLKVMGFGMFGILVVMCLIYLLIFILNKATAPKDDEGKDKK